MASKFLGFIKSLKWRLIVMSMLLAIVPSLIVGNGILLSYEMRALSIRQSEVMGQARIIANRVATNNYIDGEKTKFNENISVSILSKNLNIYVKN